MLRLAPLLLLLFAGCQRPVTAVLTYAPAPATVGGEESDRKITSGDVVRTVVVLEQRLRDRNLPCRVSSNTSNQVRVEVYDEDPALVQEIDRLICMTGTFELRIAANSVDHAELIDRAKETEEHVVRNDQDEPLGWWVPINQGKKSAVLGLPDLITRDIEHDGRTIVELLVVDDPYRVDGSMLVRATPAIDTNGRPNIAFQFSATGGRLMGALTMENLPDEISGQSRRLAIIVNGRILSTPAIQSAIRDRAEITGDFTEEEVQELANVLNSSTLPVRLTRVSIGRAGDQ